MYSRTLTNTEKQVNSDTRNKYYDTHTQHLFWWFHCVNVLLILRCKDTLTIYKYNQAPFSMSLWFLNKIQGTSVHSTTISPQRNDMLLFHIVKKNKLSITCENWCTQMCVHNFFLIFSWHHPCVSFKFTLNVFVTSAKIVELIKISN